MASPAPTPSPVASPAPAASTSTHTLSQTPSPISHSTPDPDRIQIKSSLAIVWIASSGTQVNLNSSNRLIFTLLVSYLVWAGDLPEEPTGATIHPRGARLGRR
ncbi:hypothetical protein ABZP36_020979 [Zizania latifolia]